MTDLFCESSFCRVSRTDSWRRKSLHRILGDNNSTPSYTREFLWSILLGHFEESWCCDSFRFLGSVERSPSSSTCRSTIPCLEDTDQTRRPLSARDRASLRSAHRPRSNTYIFHLQQSWIGYDACLALSLDVTASKPLT